MGGESVLICLVFSNTASVYVRLLVVWLVSYWVFNFPLWVFIIHTAVIRTTVGLCWGPCYSCLYSSPLLWPEAVAPLHHVMGVCVCVCVKVLLWLELGEDANLRFKNRHLTSQQVSDLIRVLVYPHRLFFFIFLLTFSNLSRPSKCCPFESTLHLSRGYRLHPAFAQWICVVVRLTFPMRTGE